MATSPVSGALSQTQLAVLEQIRALRAPKTAAPIQATAPTQPAVPMSAKPVAAPPTQPLATAAATASPTSANRPRGSILNITV